MQVIIGGDKDYRDWRYKVITVIQDWHESTSIPEIDIRFDKKEKMTRKSYNTMRTNGVGNGGFAQPPRLHWGGCALQLFASSNTVS